MTQRLRVVWVTSADAEVEHAVTPDDLAAMVARPAANYLAMCGTQFVPAAMICEPVAKCGLCGRLLAALRVTASPPSPSWTVRLRCWWSERRTGALAKRAS